MEEIALVPAGHDVVDQLPGDVPRVGLHRSHALGGEGLLHEGSYPRVLWWIFPQQRVDFRLFLRSGHWREVRGVDREKRS